MHVLLHDFDIIKTSNVKSLRFCISQNYRLLHDK